MRNIRDDQETPPPYFTDDAFRWNEEGDITPAQAAMLQRYLGAFTRAFVLQIIFITVVFVIIGLIVLRVGDFDSPDSEPMLPFLMGVLGNIFMLIMIWMVWIYYQARHVRRPIISKAEGIAKKTAKQSSVGWIYHVNVGKTRLRVQDRGTYDAFEEGQHYTVYYIKHRPMQIVLSRAVTE